MLVIRARVIVPASELSVTPWSGLVANRALILLVKLKLFNFSLVVMLAVVLRLLRVTLNIVVLMLAMVGALVVMTLLAVVVTRILVTTV